MPQELLHVITLELTAQTDAQSALRHLRRLAGSAQDQHSMLLLFCDLGPAQAQVLAGDASIIRALQSGVMAMEAQRPGAFSLIVRRRVWSDAARMYLGRDQALSCREVIAQLMETGSTQAAFEAATIAPASLKARFSSVLFSDASLACTPDTPWHMLAILRQQASGAVAAAVRHPVRFPQSTLARLAQQDGFFLSPLRAAQCWSSARKGLVPSENPALYTRDALIASLHAPPDFLPLAQGCFFVRESALSLPELFRAQRMCTLQKGGTHVLLPFAQLAMLFLAAFTGVPLLLLAAFLPEAWALMHPAQWPHALLRMVLLPLTVLVSLDALLCRLFSRSRVLRLRVPDGLISPRGCLLAGAALLWAAFLGTYALAVLLPLCLLWISAPLLLPALSAPTLERIPLSDDQLSQFRQLAENAYFDAEQGAAVPSALRMLTVCAACMLGILEPDEAARQAQSLLSAAPACSSVPEQAALLVCAQAFRERMRDCDAALRPLPAQLEDAVRANPPPKGDSPLGALLRLARGIEEDVCTVCSLASASPVEQLFLPLRPSRGMAQHALSLPLTHPHTYLKRHLLTARSSSIGTGDPAWRFLFLAAAALGHPFCALLQRSPVAGPYTVVWALGEAGGTLGISSPNP